MRIRNPPNLVASIALTLAGCLMASCSGGASSSSSLGSSDADTSPSSSQGASAVRFHSPEYGYTVTLPAGWTALQAHTKWDGKSELTRDSFGVDLFVGPSYAISFGAAAAWTHGLASYARYLIASTVRYHSDTCPRKPNIESGIGIGGRHGVLLGYNCGILINIAATVRNGVGYMFVFHDDSVQAATDRTDHATFVKILRSVQFPH
jgi:hypothetical protein